MLTSHASEGEHANLGSDVVPGARSPKLLQSLPQAFPHLLDASTHCPDAFLPVMVEELLVRPT